MIIKLDDSILEGAVAAWGISAQVEMCVEECAELIVALKHADRGRNSEVHVIEELADVVIMCAQLAKNLDEDSFNKFLKYKMGRLKNRLPNTEL